MCLGLTLLSVTVMALKEKPATIWLAAGHKPCDECCMFPVSLVLPPCGPLQQKCTILFNARKLCYECLLFFCTNFVWNKG